MHDPIKDDIISGSQTGIGDGGSASIGVITTSVNGAREVHGVKHGGGTEI